MPTDVRTLFRWVELGARKENICSYCWKLWVIFFIRKQKAAKAEILIWRKIKAHNFQKNNSKRFLCVCVKICVSFQCWKSRTRDAYGQELVSRGCTTSSEVLPFCTRKIDGQRKRHTMGQYNIDCCYGDYCNEGDFPDLPIPPDREYLLPIKFSEYNQKPTFQPITTSRNVQALNTIQSSTTPC